MAARVKARAPAGAATPKRPKLSSVPGSGRENAGADRLVYERVRLGIMSALAVREQLTFNQLKELFDVSDGNLSAHARKLEEAGYLTCTKPFEDRRPQSVYRLPSPGRAPLIRFSHDA